MTTRPRTPDAKMIRVTLYFWTDAIDKPGHCETGGVVDVAASKRHGITHTKARYFNGLLDMGPQVAACLFENGVTLHASRMDRKLLQGDYPNAKRARTLYPHARRLTR